MGNQACCAKPADEKDIVKIPTQDAFDNQEEEPKDVVKVVTDPTVCTITFLDETGTEIELKFAKKPLGFKYVSGKAPLKVSGILDEGCVKETGLPVRVGWAIKAVNGKILNAEPQRASEEFLEEVKKTF
ncbi:unnamed protein product [Cladocopium goreaui]|uniref:Protein PyrBI n=1 Tax=Cladocopium goreaui TaxID=2562237 RepID=A0A9P1FKQ0_9DINO|nr:unnamed protein product [Cladocopium goreaui]